MGNYSPTEVAVAKSAAEIIAAISAPQFDFAKQVVMSTPIDASLVSANNMRLSLIRGGLHVSGSSTGTSFVRPSPITTANADRLIATPPRTHRPGRSQIHRLPSHSASARLMPRSRNMWSLALLTRMLAHQCDLEPGEAVWMGGDVHLYLNHAALVEEQLSRAPSGEARLAIARRPESMFDYRIEDFEVTGYAPQAHISAPVAV